MWDSIMSSISTRLGMAVSTGGACAVTGYTLGQQATPNFKADDVAFSLGGGVVCGTAGFFGIDISNTISNVKDRIMNGFYSAQPTSVIETVKQATPNLVLETCDAIYSNSTIVPTVFETVKQAAPNLVLETCDAIYSNATITPTVFETVKQATPNLVLETCDAIYPNSTIVPTVFESVKKVAPSFLNTTAQTTLDTILKNGTLETLGSAARSVYDATPYIPYVSEAVNAQPILATSILYNGYQAIKNGTTALGAVATVADTAVRGYALPLMTRTGVEMLSNATGGMVSSDMINLPAQIATQVLYAKAKSAVSAYRAAKENVVTGTAQPLQLAEVNIQAGNNNPVVSPSLLAAAKEVKDAMKELNVLLEDCNKTLILSKPVVQQPVVNQPVVNQPVVNQPGGITTSHKSPVPQGF